MMPGGFGKARGANKTVVEEEISISWNVAPRAGGAAALEPEPEPEPAAPWHAESAWQEIEELEATAPAAPTEQWQGKHVALDGAKLGEVFASAADTRSYEEVRSGGDEGSEQQGATPSFPSAGSAQREVVDWLGRAGLASHAQALVALGLSSMEHCAAVTPEDLAAAGMRDAEMRSYYAALRDGACIPLELAGVSTQAPPDPQFRFPERPLTDWLCAARGRGGGNGRGGRAGGSGVGGDGGPARQAARDAAGADARALRRARPGC